MRAPIFSYDHADLDGTGTNGGASANGGTFYRGTVYPPLYQNAEFILDYNRQWIRYLTFDAQGHATVNNFGKENSGGMVQVLTGPDSNLYVVVLNGSGSQVRRIRYVGAGNTPPTAVANATPDHRHRAAGRRVLQRGLVRSRRPAARPTAGTSATGPRCPPQQNPSHTYTASGVYTATLTLTELTSPFATRSTTVRHHGGQRAAAGAHHVARSTAAPTRSATSSPTQASAPPAASPIDPSQLTWELRLHHNEHIHFNLLDPGAGGTFGVIQHGDNTHYEICLTATVDQTLTDTQCVNIFPQTVPITLTTDPVGLLVNYENEGLTQASPLHRPSGGGLPGHGLGAAHPGRPDVLEAGPTA